MLQTSFIVTEVLQGVKRKKYFNYSEINRF